MKFNIVGEIFSTSGYASHIKGLITALEELGHEVRLDCPKPQGWEQQVNDFEYKALTREYSDDMITIFIGLPPFWRLSLADYKGKFYGFVVWEGKKVPKYWMEYIMDSRVDGILVPSQHTKDSIMYYDKYIGGNILNKRIHIIPHGYDASIFKPENKKDTDNFVFVCNKGWSQGINDRGGVQYLLKAFKEEFLEDEPVELRIKINPTYCGPNWNLNLEMQKAGIPEKGGLVKINADSVEFRKLSNFYNSGDVFVCPTKGEAFNLPGLEAKACGLPTIQTNFGGQLDYMNEETDFYLSYELEEVTWDINHEGNYWALPNLMHLRKTMREVFRNRKHIDYYKRRAIEDVKEFTWRNSVKKLIEVVR